MFCSSRQRSCIACDVAALVSRGSRVKACQPGSVAAVPTNAAVLRDSASICDGVRLPLADSHCTASCACAPPISTSSALENVAGRGSHEHVAFRLGCSTLRGAADRSCNFVVFQLHAKCARVARGILPRHLFSVRVQGNTLSTFQSTKSCNFSCSAGFISSACQLRLSAPGILLRHPFFLPFSGATGLRISLCIEQFRLSCMLALSFGACQLCEFAWHPSHKQAVSPSSTMT